MIAAGFVICDEETGAFWSSVDHGELMTIAPDVGASPLKIATDHARKWDTLLEAVAALSMFPDDGAQARVLHYPSLAAAVIQHKNEGL